MVVNSAQFDGVALVGRSTQPIRSLQGFDKKRHVLPQSMDDYSQRFVAEISNPELDSHLENTYQSLRSAYKFKRKELKRITPAPGCGCVETPFFLFTIQASHCYDDPNLVTWERSVIQIKSPEQILSPPFATVFDGQFDRIEFTLDPPIDLEDWIDHLESLDHDRLRLDYDSQVSYCRLTIDQVNAVIEVSESIVSVAQPRPTQTNQILTAFLEVRETILESFGEFFELVQVALDCSGRGLEFPSKK